MALSTTAAAVAAWGRFSVPTDTDELAALTRVAAAVDEYLSREYLIDDPPTDAQQQAAVMQAARLWRRRDTPEGVATFDEFGAIRVASTDPDVRALLVRRINLA